MKRTRGRPRRGADEERGTPADVQRILSDLGEKAKYVTLWKLDGPKEIWIDTFAPDQWSLEKVRSYGAGAGDYRVRIAEQRDRGDGKTSQWTVARTFSIWAPPGGASTSAIGAGPSTLDKILLAVAGPLAAALATRLLSEPKTDPLLLELVKATAKGGGPDAVAVQQLVTTASGAEFEKGRALGRAEAMAENSGGDSDSPLVAAIHELGPILSGAMKSTTPKQPATGTARIAADPATAAAAATAASAPSWVAKVRPFVKHMLAWADAGMTPEAKATNMVDDLEHMAPADYQALGVSCESESFVHDVLTTWLPELASTDARREWFTKFLVEIQETLAPVEDGNDDDEGGAASGESGGGGESGAGSRGESDRGGDVADVGGPAIDGRSEVVGEIGRETGDGSRARARGSKRGAGKRKPNS